MPFYVDDKGERFFGMGFDLTEDAPTKDFFQEERYSGRGIFRIKAGAAGLLQFCPWLGIIVGVVLAVLIFLWAGPKIGVSAAILGFLAGVGLTPALLIPATTTLHRIDRRLRLADPQPFGLLWFPILQGLAMIPAAWAIWSLVQPMLPQREEWMIWGLQGFCGILALLGAVLMVQQAVSIARMKDAIRLVRR